MRHQKSFRQFTGQGVEKTTTIPDEFFSKTQTIGMQLGMFCSYREENKAFVIVKERRQNMKNKTVNTKIVRLLIQGRKGSTLAEVPVNLKVNHLLNSNTSELTSTNYEKMTIKSQNLLHGKRNI